MGNLLGRSARATLVFLAVLALVVGACSSGSSSTKNTTAAKTPHATQAADQSDEAGSDESAEATQDSGNKGGAVDVTTAASKLSAINSYQFKMDMAGGMFDSLSMLSSDKSASTFTMTGTIIAKPTKAASIDMMGMKMIEVGGKSYINFGGTWTETTDDSTSGIADSFAPDKMFKSYSTFGFKKADEGQKNGVAAVHYTVDASDMNSYASMLGVKGAADWKVETWIAKDGGYPVSMTMSAKQGSDYAFLFTMDITHVNDAANKVEKPI